MKKLFSTSTLKRSMFCHRALVMAAAFALAAPIMAGAADQFEIDMHKSMNTMHEKMTSMPMSGNPDIDFAMMMRQHHQGALDMAQAELDHGKDPVMRSTAKKIIAAQKKEMAEFDRWLARHKK